MGVSLLGNIRIVHIIPGLGKSGAETMLYQLIKYKTNKDIKHTVVSLGLSFYYEEFLRKLDTEVIVYDLKRHPIRTFWRIRHMLDEKDVLCCWMYLGNLIGYLVGYKRVAKIIWNIRHADLDWNLNSMVTIVTSFLCAHISKRIDIITYNGNRSKTNHEAAGYSDKRSRVIRNGCDTSLYNYDENTRKTVRHELGIPDGQEIVLSVARNHKIKDLPTFIQAFVYIHNSCPDSVAVMCGKGVDSNDAELIGLCDRLGLVVGKDILFLGFRDDVKSLFCAADEYILHSAGEAFPNTLIQAMACGVPCVATDVGDAREIIGDDRYIAPVSDPKALAEKCIELLQLDESSRENLRKRNRRIVEDKYDINEVIKKYEEIITSIVSDHVLYIGQFELPDKNAAAQRVMRVAKSMRECGAKVVLCGASKEYNKLTKHSDVVDFEAYSRKYPIAAFDWITYIWDIKEYAKLSYQYGINCIIGYNIPAVLSIRINRYCRKNGILFVADITEWYDAGMRKWPMNIIKKIDEFFRIRVVNKHADGRIVISKKLKKCYGGDCPKTNNLII